MAYLRTPAETAAIGLIEKHTLVRSLSPELMLVDPELAARARELLREPHEANGKGKHMSALGTHEITAGMSLGLEPPLSPPVVRSPMASAMPTGDGLAGLPTPPPAIRPPERSPVAPAPTPQAEVPQQPEPAPAPTPAPAPAIGQPEAVLPVVAPEPVQAQPEPPAMAPHPDPTPELPTMAPAEPVTATPVVDYFAAEGPAAPAPEAAPAEELEPVQPVPGVEAEPVVEPAAPVELRALPLVAPAAPAAPAAEPEVELPTMAPLEEEPAFEPEPAAFFVPQPVELQPVAPEPEILLAPEPMGFDLPVVERVVETQPTTSPELEELFAPQRGTFSVVVRLKDAEGVEVGSFRDFGTAMEGAQEVIDQFSTATEGKWPFYAGRFIRPDLIVSVDVVEGEDEF
jgi:hypothetical protein